MSLADNLFLQNCRDILANGVWDTDYDVRTRWEDGTPAHTIKKFGLVNRYDLSVEFPALTVRRTALKSAVDELTIKLNNNGYEVLSGPRTTGDGYYESSVIAIENNIIELTE